MQEIFKTLTEQIKTNNEIILMAHKNIDLDAFGSLLCLYEIIKSFDKKVSIVLNKENNNSVTKTIDLLKENNQDINYFKGRINQDSLLIIVDVNQVKRVENDELLNKVKNIIVLDHHIKDEDNIKNTIATYINSNLSSTVEIIVGYLKYLNKTISSIIATIMLAGIEIDTNNFDIKTTETTYETAAYLTKLGADNLIKKELLKETKEKYFKRQELIKKAKMINDSVALCVFDNKIYTKEDLAIIATDLLQFDNVKAGFTIGKISDKEVGVSAKSLGDINVASIMQQLGGGGHLNNAATQLKDMSLEEVKEKLLDLLK